MEIYTADQIRDITEKNIESTYEHKLVRIFNICIDKAKENKYQAELYSIEIDEPLKKYLKTLGYELIKSKESLNYIISW